MQRGARVRPFWSASSLPARRSPGTDGAETWPGNATDVQALLPVIDRLRQRFAIGRICVVADRGMISARTLAELDARGIEYILGTRERSDAEVRESVLTDTAAMVPLSIPKASGSTTDIEVKEVLVRPWDGKGKPRRYVVCYNPARAAWEAAQRGAIIAALQEHLSRGDKSLVGNSGFRKFLKVVGDDHFALDEAKVAEEARLDGFYVLRTNSKLPTLEVAMRYRELWKVEQIFRTTKAVLETRPIYHSSDAAIRGHVFCSFLALTLRKELDDRLQAAGLQLEWQDVIGDLDRLVQTTVDSEGRRFVLRNQGRCNLTSGFGWRRGSKAYRLFQLSRRKTGCRRPRIRSWPLSWNSSSLKVRRGWPRCSRRCSISPCAWSGSASSGPGCTNATPIGAATPTATRARRSTPRAGR